MYRILIVILMMVLASVACFSTEEDPTSVPVRQGFATVTPVPTSFAPTQSFATSAFPTASFNTGGATQVFVATSAVQGPGFQTTNCAIPGGWQPYTVAAGDTLAVIADSVGSSVDVVQSANCITNADSIFVGQVIYLPNLPSVVVIPTTNFTTPVPTTCPIPANWQPYTVRSGDSLSLIAISIGSSVSVIQSGNCITNADAIFVGQLLYLPSLPSVIFVPTAATGGTFPTATFAPTPTLASGGTGTIPTFSQLLRITPTQVRSDGAVVTTQRTVSLDVGVVPNANVVRYYAGTSASDQNPVQIGIDNDPFDGTRVNYTLADFDTQIFVIAIAQNEAGFTYSNIVKLVYDPNFSTATGSPVIQPFLSFAGTTYTLQPNVNVNVSWPTAPQDATRVEFYYLPSNGASPQVIGTDSTPNNGSLITWLVPSGLNGQVFGRAVYTNRIQDSERITVGSQ